MSKWLPHVLLSIVLCLLVTVGYWPAFSAGFVDFDDPDYVTANPWVSAGVSTENLGWAFTRAHSNNWHPLTWISHMADVELFGLEPAGHHVVNAILHAANAVLLFWMLATVTGELWNAFLVAALFAVCPVNVESVAWIAQRKTTLSTLFAILCLWAYAGHVLRHSKSLYILSLCFLALSLASKQMFVTMPLLLMLFDYWPLQRMGVAADRGRQSLRDILRGFWRFLPDKLPFFALSLAAGCITLIVQRGSMRSLDTHPWSMRLGNVLLSFVRYLVKLAWPLDLAVFYPLHESDITATAVAGSLLLLIAITAVVLHCGRSRGYLIFGWLWYLVALLPVIGILHVGAQALADRYVYVPYLGLFIAAAWLLRDLLATWATAPAVKMAASVLLALLLVVWTGLCYRQSQNWRSTPSLFEHAVAVTQGNYVAHRSLADYYYSKQDYPRALEHSEQALRSGKDRGRILSTHGLIRFELGQPKEAVDALREAATLDPENPSAFMNLGWILLQTGQPLEAEQQFALAAARLKHGSPPFAVQNVHANWGRSLALLRRYEEAAQKLQIALSVDPLQPDIIHLLAEAELQFAPQRAIDRLEPRVDSQSDDLRGMHLLSKAYLATGRSADAAALLARVIQREPTFVDAALLLASIHVRGGRFSDATTVLENALRNSDKQSAQTRSMLLVQLAAVAISAREFREAAGYFDQALNVWPDNYVANNNAAWLLATCSHAEVRQPKRALQLANHACDLTGRRDPSSLGTLAAALAADGQMEQAVRTASNALELAGQAKNQTAVQSLREQLAIYQSGKPFVQPE